MKNILILSPLLLVIAVPAFLPNPSGHFQKAVPWVTIVPSSNGSFPKPYALVTRIGIVSLNMERIRSLVEMCNGTRTLDVNVKPQDCATPRALLAAYDRSFEDLE